MVDLLFRVSIDVLSVSFCVSIHLHMRVSNIGNSRPGSINAYQVSPSVRVQESEAVEHNIRTL